jgi:hypothetical protein
MPLSANRYGRKTWTLQARVSAFVLALAGGWLGLSGKETAAEVSEPPRFTRAEDYSAARDWFIRAENLVPHGRNPYFFPIVPGHRHIFERPDHPDGQYRRETVVLDEMEAFDVPDIGQFNAAVVQDEEYVDGVLEKRTRTWVVIDRTNNNVFSVGEVEWEIDEGKQVLAGLWRVGEPSGRGIAEPGLLMPGTFLLGARYIFDGSEGDTASGAENMEAGIAVTAPAGSFQNCVRVRVQNLRDHRDIVDRVHCPEVGVVSDTSEGQLVASAALPAGHPGADVSGFGHFLRNPVVHAPPEPKLTAEQAREVALRALEGRAMAVAIERKRGKYVYTVEVITPEGQERDVFVDIESGEVVGTE